MYSVLLGGAISTVVFAALGLVGLPWPIAIFFWLLGPVIGGTYAISEGGWAPQTKVEHSRWKLASMQFVTETQGVFVYGCGTLNGTLRYNVMLQNEDGSYSPHWLPVAFDNTRIVEDESLTDTGLLIVTEEVADRTWKAGWVRHADSGERFYEYRVPRGSVRNNFAAN